MQADTRRPPHPPLFSSLTHPFLFVSVSLSNCYVEHRAPTFMCDLILSHFIRILRLLRWICLHMADLSRALKETLETLHPNQSVSPFTCWSICVLICSWSGSPQWTVINVEDQRGDSLVTSGKGYPLKTMTSFPCPLFSLSSYTHFQMMRR